MFDYSLPGPPSASQIVFMCTAPVTLDGSSASTEVTAVLYSLNSSKSDPKLSASILLSLRSAVTELVPSLFMALLSSHDPLIAAAHEPSAVAIPAAKNLTPVLNPPRNLAIQLLCCRLARRENELFSYVCGIYRALSPMESSSWAGFGLVQLSKSTTV